MSESPKQILQRYSTSVRLEPGLPDHEIAAFESQLPEKLPPEIRELLMFSAGFEVHPESISGFPYTRHVQPFAFTGTNGIAFPVFPCLVDLLHDGAGNFWVVEVDAHGTWGHVFFASHDPPVIAVQAGGLSEFMLQVLEPALSSPTRALRHVHDRATTEIWRSDPWITSRQDARVSEDPVLRNFAESVPEGFHIADLRKGEIGSGFSWGKAGPDTEIRRCGSELLFAFEEKRPGFWKRLFSSK